MLTTSEDTRSQLFISYACEDSVFAEWLELKLTSAGYKVWRDRSSLYGGDRWTDDIETALERSSFRVLGLLSKHSLAKENPKKERTKAMQIGNRLNIPDFLITINVDGVSVLDWQTIDINYIDFSESWAIGLGYLLKTLEHINTPKNEELSQYTINEWMSQLNKADKIKETVHTNIIEFITIPDKLLRIECLKPIDNLMLKDYFGVFKRQNDQVYWSLEPPSILDPDSYNAIELAWSAVDYYENIRVLGMMKYLLFTHLKRKLTEKGLQYDEKHRYFIFTDSASPNGKIVYSGLNGRSSFIKTKGERKFSVESFIYRLVFSVSIIYDSNKKFALIITPNYAFYESTGDPIAPRKVVSRRKRMCRSLYNHQWLIRLYAIVQWLVDNDCLSLGVGMSSRDCILLNSKLLECTCDVGIQSDYRNINHEISELHVDTTEGEV